MLLSGEVAVGRRADGAVEEAATVGSERSRLSVLRTFAELEALGPEWLVLERSTSTRLLWFQSHAWCRNWCAVHGQTGRVTPYIVVLREGEKLVAIWPLMIERVGPGVSVLRTLGDPHSQYSSLICAPGGLSICQAEQMRNAVLGERSADALVVGLVPEGSELEKILPPAALVPSLANASFALDLSPYDDKAAYIAALSKKQRRNRNKRRQMLDAIGTLGFEVVWPDDERFTGLLNRCLSFKRDWLRANRLVSQGLGVARHDDFLSRLPGSMRDGEGALLSVLSLDGRPVAVELGFLHGARYYAYLGGFDWNLRAASPGKVQMDLTVGWLIENGITAYDLLAHPADYKEKWCNSTVPLAAYAVSRNWRGALYINLWLGRMRPALKRLAARLAILRPLAAPGPSTQ